jgi:hypothetical protein
MDLTLFLHNGSTFFRGYFLVSLTNTVASSELATRERERATAQLTYSTLVSCIIGCCYYCWGGAHRKRGGDPNRVSGVNRYLYISVEII